MQREGKLSWSWSWWLFAVATVICTIISQFSRGMMNMQNIARHGPEADYRAKPGMAIFGSIVAGAVYAAVVTAIAGFIVG